jgi:hypothetical protein
VTTEIECQTRPRRSHPLSHRVHNFCNRLHIFEIVATFAAYASISSAIGFTSNRLTFHLFCNRIYIPDIAAIFSATQSSFVQSHPPRIASRSSFCNLVHIFRNRTGIFCEAVIFCAIASTSIPWHPSLLESHPLEVQARRYFSARNDSRSLRNRFFHTSNELSLVATTFGGITVT